ncbi:MAG TPA: hypothetical protein VFZ59_22515, partial [Verrucomicrobiae bacterium]|nr:hypothetical protein [Verrucomicrobiae bacterium]
APALGQRAAGRVQRRMGNRKNLPQHGMPNPALCLMLDEFTEKNLRRLFQFVLSNPLLWIDPFGLDKWSMPLLFSDGHPEEDAGLDDFLKPCGKWLWNQIRSGLENFVFNQVFELGDDRYYSRPDLGYPFVRRRDDDGLRFRLMPRFRGFDGIGLGVSVGNNNWSFGTRFDYKFNSDEQDSDRRHERRLDIGINKKF